MIDVTGTSAGLEHNQIYSI